MSDQLVLALDVGGSSVKSAVVAASQDIMGSVCVDTIQSGARCPDSDEALGHYRRSS